MLFATLALGFMLPPNAAPVRRMAPVRHSSIQLAAFDDAIAASAPSVALVLPHNAPSPLTEGAAAASGSALSIEVQGEAYLLTAAHVVGDDETHVVALPNDNFEARHNATVVARAPAVDLCLLKLPEGVEPPPAVALDAIIEVEEGDFAIALSAVEGKCALGVVKTKTRTGPTLAAGAWALDPPTGSAEWALAEAEQEAEQEALARGEQPFLVVDAPSVKGAVGGPLLGADGALLGLTTLVLSSGKDATRYYGVSNRRMGRAVGTMLERRSLGETEPGTHRGARVVFFNDPENKQEAVQDLLEAVGLSEQAASFATNSARSTGRGVIGYFEDAEEAKNLVKKIVFAEKGKRLPRTLVLTAETFDFHKNTDGAAPAKRATSRVGASTGGWRRTGMYRDTAEFIAGPEFVGRAAEFERAKHVIPGAASWHSINPCDSPSVVAPTTWQANRVPTKRQLARV